MQQTGAFAYSRTFQFEMVIDVDVLVFRPVFPLWSWAFLQSTEEVIPRSSPKAAPKRRTKF